MALVFDVAGAGTTGGATLTVVDFRTAAGTTAPADASGVITYEFPPVDAGYLWLVERITVMCPSTTPTQAIVYAGGVSPTNFVDGTDRGNLDTADESSPILVDSSVVLTCQWTGASLGARGTVRVQYQLVQRS
jgi:hypothetical protein